MRLIALIVLGFASLSAVAQQPVTPPTTVQVTEVEQLKLENAKLEMRLIETEFNKLQQEQASKVTSIRTLIDQIKKDHKFGDDVTFDASDFTFKKKAAAPVVGPASDTKKK